MKIAIAKPPCWDAANALFRLEELDLGTVFTYGDTLYNPFNVQLSYDLIAHEEEHARQQMHDDTCAKLWWDRYIRDPEFRIEQEGMAYGAQYRCICKRVKDRNARARQLHGLVEIFSGAMYGDIISHPMAQDTILKYSRTVDKSLASSPEPHTDISG